MTVFRRWTALCGRPGALAPIFMMIQAVVATLILGACTPREPAPVALRNVITAEVVSAPREAATLSGTVQARYSTPLAFRVGGLLVERQVRSGDNVKAKQALASLANTDARNTAASARAARDSAQERLRLARIQRDRDDAQAKANLIAAAQREQSADAYAAALGQYQQSRRQLALSEDQVAYHTLRADHDGIIVAENADTGQVVTAGQTIYTLAWSGKRDIVVDVAEGGIAQLHIGMPATVAMPALPDRQWSAHIREIAPAADPQSQTFRVKLTLDDPALDANPHPQIKLGMTAIVDWRPATEKTRTAISGATEKSSSAANPSDGSQHATLASASTTPSLTAIPATALFHQGTTPAVWIVQPDTHRLSLRAVTVAGFTADHVLIASGIGKGEQVVAKGVQLVAAGEVVTPVTTEAGE